MSADLNDLWVIFLIFICVFFAISAIIASFYLLNLQNLLKEIDQKNRLIEPGNVWLMFIPLFNYVYAFILYPKICDSVKNEYEARGIGIPGDYSQSIAITMAVLGLCWPIPYIGSIASLANIVLFIIFWVKTVEYKNKLKSTPKGKLWISSKVDILD